MTFANTTNETTFANTLRKLHLRTPPK